MNYIERSPLESQLDVLASEASYLNDFSSDSVSYSSEFNDCGLNEPHPYPKRNKNYLKCILAKQHGENEPLLPIHSSPVPVAPVENTDSIYAMILKNLVSILWNYILPGSMRDWFIRNRYILGAVVLVIIVAIVVFLLLTGNLDGVLYFTKVGYCWVCINLFPDSFYAGICKS